MVKKIKHHWVSGTAAGQKKPGTTIVELIGAADDRGVLNVGGRLGAGHGPQAVRSMLGQFMLGMHGSIGKLELIAGRDADPGQSIEEGHAAVRNAVRRCIEQGSVPLVLGGGHDYGYPHVAGASDALKGKVALINIDAHLDVRPVGSDGITSGSPFFLALESGAVAPRNFVELGIQEHCNDESFYKYVESKGVRVVMLEEARQSKGGAPAFLERLVAAFAKKGLKTVVSFDVDAVQMAYAPGVSAPQADGFTPGDLLAMAQFCGESKDVATVGFFELAPPLDEQARTTRLVATAVHRYLSGISRRGEKKSRRKILLGRR